VALDTTEPPTQGFLPGGVGVAWIDQSGLAENIVSIKMHALTRALTRGERILDRG
jgi:hypothetical protein